MIMIMIIAVIATMMIFINLHYKKIKERGKGGRRVARTHAVAACARLVRQLPPLGLSVRSYISSCSRGDPDRTIFFPVDSDKIQECTTGAS